MKTMVHAFTRAVDYSTNRLRNREETLGRKTSPQMFHLKQQVDGLQPSIHIYDGKKLIRLLAFFASLRDTFDMLGTSEAAVIRVLAYFLEGEAMDVHAEQFGLVEFDFEADQPVTSDNGSLRHVIHAILRRFLTGDVLREAHDAVSRAEQRENEDEGEFPERISKAARLFRHVFSKDELINNYVHGLRTSVRQIVIQQVRQMPSDDRGSL